MFPFSVKRISRRAFIKISALWGAAAALSGKPGSFVGCETITG